VSSRTARAIQRSRENQKRKKKKKKKEEEEEERKGIRENKTDRLP
jgi:hypothetical protein